jgi:arginase family enzyme
LGDQSAQCAGDKSGATRHRRLAGAARRVKEARKRGTNVLTIEDIEKLGLEKSAEIALELAWEGADAVYISFDVDSLDCGLCRAPAGRSRAGSCRAKR